MPTPFPRGRVARPDLVAVARASHARHGDRLRRLATPTAPSFDWRTLGKVPPIKNQLACGSCWDFSGCGTATCAMIQAGLWPADGSMSFSEQYYLDCVRTGGCNGDDNTTVLDDIKAHGAPTEADYGPYRGGRSSCRSSASMARARIDDWGFADSNGNTGLAPVRDIKAALVTYGPVGCAVAAGSDWDVYMGGVSAGIGSTGINHDVMIVGWQDDARLRAGGYWIVRNQWGPGWGESGYMRLQYGADQIGTEAVWAVVHAAPPPTPVPVPVPPTPTPTPPPAPALPATTGTFDTSARTVMLPAGWGRADWGYLVISPDTKTCLMPPDWTILPRP